MSTSKFYLAVSFIVLMAAEQNFTKNLNLPNITTVATENLKSQSQITNGSQPSSATHTPEMGQNSAKTTVSPAFPTTSGYCFINKFYEKVLLTAGGAVFLGLLVFNVVLVCCICCLKRRISYWAIPKNRTPTNMTEDRDAGGDAGLPADRAVELSTIYTMPDKTKQDGNGEEACTAEGATVNEADPANSDAQGLELAEALPAELPDDAAEVLLVV